MARLRKTRTSKKGLTASFNAVNATNENLKECLPMFTEATVEEIDKSVEDGFTNKIRIDGIDQESQEELEKFLRSADVTPSQYFNLLKGMKHDLDNTSVDSVIMSTKRLIGTAVATGQKKMADKLATKMQLLLKERNAVEKGYKTVVNRTDIQAWIASIVKQDSKSNTVSPIVCSELKDYTHEIPPEVIEKLVDARDVFEKFLIIHTDYTGETKRTVEKEKRDKDPVLFGLFMVKTDSGNLAPSEHFFFIADWIDEYCDLTLEQLLKETEKVVGHDPKIPVEEITTTDMDEINELLKQVMHE